MRFYKIPVLIPRILEKTRKKDAYTLKAVNKILAIQAREQRIFWRKF